MIKPREFYMDTDILDKALDRCDLGDSQQALVRQYPHKDHLKDYTRMIEYSAYERVANAYAEIYKNYAHFMNECTCRLKKNE
jgi:hypothetical protein